MTAHAAPPSTMRASHACTSGASVVVWPETLSTSRPLTLKATVLIAPATMPLACRTCPGTHIAAHVLQATGLVAGPASTVPFKVRGGAVDHRSAEQSTDGPAARASLPAL